MTEIEYLAVRCYNCLRHKPLYTVVVDDEAEGPNMDICKKCVERHKRGD